MRKNEERWVVTRKEGRLPVSRRVARVLFVVAVVVPAWLVTLAVGSGARDGERPGRPEARVAGARPAKKATAAKARASKKADRPGRPNLATTGTAAAKTAASRAVDPAPAPVPCGAGLDSPGPIALGRIGREPEPPPGLATLAPRSGIFGVVTDSTGRPVADASVDAIANDGAALEAASGGGDGDGALGQGTLTDAAGRYSLPYLEPGAYAVFASHPLYRPAVREGVRVDEASGAIEADLRLERGPGLAGRVVGAGGEPVPGASVTATLRDEAVAESGAPVRGLARVAVTDAAGEFLIGGLPTGSYAVSASADAYLPFDAAFAAVSEAGAAADLELVLEPGLSIEGTVIGASGEPRPARVRTVVSATRGGEAGTLERVAEAGPDGRFVLAGLPAGSYDLTVTPVDGRHAETIEASVPAGSGGLTIALPAAGELAGFVRDAATGEALAGVRVAAERMDAATDPTSRVAITGEDGAFAIEGLGAGTYAVLAEAADRPRTELPRVTVGAGATAAVEIRVGAGAEVAGRVVAGPGGDPVPGAVVFVGGDAAHLHLNGMDIPEGAAETDADGRFVLRGVPFGRTRLSARVPGHADATAGVDVDLAPGTGATAVLLVLDRSPIS